jgi:hypothetical protein
MPSQPCPAIPREEFRTVYQKPVHSRWSKVEVEVTLQLAVSQSVCLGIEHPCETCDQIVLPVGMLLSESYGLVSVGRPLWREDRSAVCSAITQWSESRRTRNHTLLSHLRLPQPGGPGSRIYIPQEQDGPVIPSGTGFRQGGGTARRSHLWRGGLRWKLITSLNLQVCFCCVSTSNSKFSTPF